jgi:hypothetical protein
MPMPNTSPVLPCTLNAGKAIVTTANTDSSGATGALVTLVTGASQGTQVDLVSATALATTAAGLLRYFLHDGTTAYLRHEVVVGVVIASSTAAAFTDDWVRSDGLPVVFVPSGWTLKVATTITQTFHVTPEARDF